MSELNLGFFILDSRLFITSTKISYRNCGVAVKEWYNHKAAHFWVCFNEKDPLINIKPVEQEQHFPRNRKDSYHSYLKSIVEQNELSSFKEVYILLRNPKQRIYSGIIECIRRVNKLDNILPSVPPPFDSNNVKQIIEGKNGNLLMDPHYDSLFYAYEIYLEKIVNPQDLNKIKYIDIDKHKKFNIPLMRKFSDYESGNPKYYTKANLHLLLEENLKKQNKNVLKQLNDHIEVETASCNKIKNLINEFVIKETIHIL